jgi:hypothetical protein
MRFTIAANNTPVACGQQHHGAILNLLTPSCKSQTVPHGTDPGSGWRCKTPYRNALPGTGDGFFGPESSTQPHFYQLYRISLLQEYVWIRHINPAPNPQLKITTDCNDINKRFQLSNTQGYGPFRHPNAPSQTVTGLRLVATTDHAIGLSMLRAFPSCVPAVATTPHSNREHCFAQFSQPGQPAPHWRTDRHLQRHFRGLLSVHSRQGLLAKSLNHPLHQRLQPLHYNMTAPIAPGWSKLYRRDSHPQRKSALVRCTPAFAVPVLLANGEKAIPAITISGVLYAFWRLLPITHPACELASKRRVHYDSLQAASVALLPSSSDCSMLWLANRFCQPGNSGRKPASGTCHRCRLYVCRHR